MADLSALATGALREIARWSDGAHALPESKVHPNAIAALIAAGYIERVVIPRPSVRHRAKTVLKVTPGGKAFLDGAA